MQELIARLGAIFSPAGGASPSRAAEPRYRRGHCRGHRRDFCRWPAVFLRVVAIPIAILIIVRCLMSLFREKTGKEIWGWLTPGRRDQAGPVPLGENAIGRGAWVDVSLDFPTVSRSHAALLRDDKETGSSNPCKPKTAPGSTGKKSPTPPPENRGHH